MINRISDADTFGQISTDVSNRRCVFDTRRDALGVGSDEGHGQTEARRSWPARLKKRKEIAG